MPLYDVFLSYATADKAAVEHLAGKLQEAGLRPFLDSWYLIPGEPWQEALENALDQSRTCAVFIGELRPWQNEEMRSALEEQISNGSVRVIPVLLPGRKKPGKKQLPRFLRRRTWVDFHGLDDEDAFRRLVSGIQGEALGPPPWPTILQDTAILPGPSNSSTQPIAKNDFFELAGLLKQELSQEDISQRGDNLLVQPAEESLEKIVEGFKKGVAEHLSPTDYDTHFNLGIAYREMGLLDEAIGEFQIAAKGPQHLVICCSILGLCFLDKGLPELAVGWYRRGLEAPGLSEEDTLDLLYNLGCAYLAVGDRDSAYSAFVDLYGINTNYRDVAARLEEIGSK